MARNPLETIMLCQLVLHCHSSRSCVVEAARAWVVCLDNALSAAAVQYRFATDAVAIVERAAGSIREENFLQAHYCLYHVVHQFDIPAACSQKSEKQIPKAAYTTMCSPQSIVEHRFFVDATARRRPHEVRSQRRCCITGKTEWLPRRASGNVRSACMYAGFYLAFPEDRTVRKSVLRPNVHHNKAVVGICGSRH